MPFAKVNDAEIYYEVHGSGFPLVLSHTGRAGLADFAQNNTPVLAQRYQLVVYDRRGCGQSKAPEGSDSPETWVQDLHGLLQHLGIQHAYIGGVSYGAMLSVEFTLAHPDMVAGLISSCGSPFGWGQGRPNAIPFPDRRDRLTSIRAPILWVYGENDQGFPPSMGEEAQGLTPGSELVVVQGAGHSPQRDAPEVFNQALLDFLARVDARRAAA